MNESNTESGFKIEGQHRYFIRECSYDEVSKECSERGWKLLGVKALRQLVTEKTEDAGLRTFTHSFYVVKTMV